jgi:hypothetical protein
LVDEITLDDLMKKATEISRKWYDPRGFVTLFGLFDGREWHVYFGLPELSRSLPQQQANSIKKFGTLKEALIDLIETHEKSVVRVWEYRKSEDEIEVIPYKNDFKGAQDLTLYIDKNDVVYRKVESPVPGKIAVIRFF